MIWICGKNSQAIDARRPARQIVTQGVVLSQYETLSQPFGRRQMKSIGSGLQGLVGFRTSSSQGDEALARFEELAWPLFDSLYNFARWIAHDADDAEDLVQETYLKALRGFASFQRGTNFRAWIFQILRNTFLSSRSKLDRRMTVAMDSEEDFPALPATSATPESLLIERSGIDAVRSAIEHLPVIFREVILLCDVEDASYREIAEILSIPMGTVMSRLARARKALRESLLSTHGAPVSRDLSHHIETYEDPGAMRKVSIDQGLRCTNEDKLPPLSSRIWRSNPEEPCKASALRTVKSTTRL
jgi:RNA polymerase sigma-70 factor, ECF subfamily